MHTTPRWELESPRPCKMSQSPPRGVECYIAAVYRENKPKEEQVSGLVYVLQASTIFGQDPNLPMPVPFQDIAVAGGVVTHGGVTVTPCGCTLCPFLWWTA